MANNLDNLIARNTVLSGEAQQELAADILRGQKQERENIAKAMLDSAGNLIKARSVTGAVKEGVEIGFDIRRRIADGKFEGGTFLAVLLLSALKDFGDLATLGTTGWLVNIVITTALFIIFFMQSSTIKRFLIKRYIWVMIPESIPFIDIFPAYTMMAILLKLKIDKDRKKDEEDLKDLEEQISQYEKLEDEN